MSVCVDDLLVCRFGWNCSIYSSSKQQKAVITVKPTRCTNFSNLFLEWNSTFFEQFLCSSSGDFAIHTSLVYVIRFMLTACSQAISKPVCMCVHWKTPDDGQRNCSKHVEFYSKNKFEKLVHLVGFIVRIYHDARSTERQKQNLCTYENNF